MARSAFTSMIGKLSSAYMEAKKSQQAIKMQIARYISCISAAKVQQKNEIRKKKRKNLALFHCLMSFEIV